MTDAELADRIDKWIAYAHESGVWMDTPTSARELLIAARDALRCR